MKDTAKYVDLDSIIYEYINQAQLTSSHFLRLWPIAVRGLKEIHIDITGEPVTRKLSVLPNKTVELPADYVRWNKIGVLNEKGEIATLLHNPQMSGYAATDDNRTSNNIGSIVTSPLGNWDFRNYYFENQCYNLFGVPPGTVKYGEFKVLEDQGVILLGNDYEFDHVIMEYLACPVANQDFRVPAVCTETLIAWIAWKDIQHHKRSSPGVVQQRKNDFYREKTNMRPKANPIRLQDMNDIFLRGNRLSIRN